MILEKIPEAKELNAVNDLYLELLKRYCCAGLNDERFNKNYIYSRAPLNRFISDFNRIIELKHIKDLDDASTSAVLEELVDMENEISKIEEDVRVYKKMGLIKKED